MKSKLFLYCARVKVFVLEERPDAWAPYLAMCWDELGFSLKPSSLTRAQYINAWAEGCHLESGHRLGWAFLAATQRAKGLHNK